MTDFNTIAATAYRARRHQGGEDQPDRRPDPWATSATGQQQGAILADLATKVYQRRAADRARFQEQEEDDAFRLATERGPDGVGGPWGHR